MAGWYRTGTVNLTNGSATVAGIGATLWANALRPGMVFTTDFHTLYEIKTVDGDAQITLDRAWAGGTVVGVAYAVIFGGAAISNAEVVAELMTMVGKWQTREDQYDDWVAGQPDGGPNGDGKYPLTDSKGVTRLITSPGRLLILIDNGLLDNVQQVVDMIEDDIAAAQQAADQATAAATTLTAYVTSADQDRQAAEAARDAVLDAKGAAATSEGNAKASETAAGNSAVTANTAATTATGARDATLTAKTATEQARDTTLTARDTTLAARDVTTAARDVTTQARDQATAAQTNAAVSAGQAADAKTTAINAAADSVDAKIHAVAAQVVAEQRRNEAADSATLAKAWASNPVGQPVASGALSAYHWAEQARTAAQTAQVIAGGYMFGVVGDGNSGRINAQAAADTLHLVAGSGMSVTYDNATRKVVFSSQARAVASEDPAITVRLDDTAALAYLGLDESKISHQALSGAGARSHAEIDTHIANTGIHVPAPGSGDVDKLLKATGAGTFAWVKGKDSNIDADKIDGYSWEEGQEVANNAGTADWVKLGRWDAQGVVARRLLITCAGGYGYGNSDGLASGGITWVMAYTADNTNTTIANTEGRFSYIGAPLFTYVKLVQVGSNRFLHDVYAYRETYSPFNFRVQCNGTWTTALAYGQTSPGSASVSVADMAALGRMLTTTDISENPNANSVVKRDGAGGFLGTNIMATGPFPGFYWFDSDSGTDAKRWGAVADNGILQFQTLNDAWSASTNWLEVTRNGNAPSGATFKVPMTISGIAPSLWLSETDNSNKAWQLVVDGGAVGLRREGVWPAAFEISSTDAASFKGNVAVGGALTVGGYGAWHAGNFDPATKAGTAVATVGANGLMSAADKQTLNGATSSATANALVARDGNGWSAFAGVTLGGNTALHAGNNGNVVPTFGGLWTGSQAISSTYPNIRFNDTDGAAGAKWARIDYENGRLALQALSDDGTTWVRDNLMVWAAGGVDAPNGSINSRQWATLGGASNGDAVVGSNLYFDSNNVLRAQYTHGSIGARGILFNWPSWGDINVVNYSGATTAGQDLSGTATAYRLLHTGNTSATNVTFNQLALVDTLTLGSSWGTNGFQKGTGDGASYTTYNYVETCWWGKAYTDYAGVVRGVYDARSGSWNIKGQYNTDAESDLSANAASFNARKGAMSSGTFNQVLIGENDTGPKLNVFVNGSTRSADGGVNTTTIRNDGGALNLGASTQPTALFGSSIEFKTAPTLNGKRVSNWEVISETTVSSSVSSALITLPNKLSAAGYKRYKLLITGLNPVAEAGLWMSMSTDGGSTWVPAGSQAHGILSMSPTSSGATAPWHEYRNGNYGSLQLSWNSAANIGFTGEFEIAQYSNVSGSVLIKGDVAGHHFNYGPQRMFSTAVVAADINLLSIGGSNGGTVNVNAGRITLLGMK